MQTEFTCSLLCCYTSAHAPERVLKQSNRGMPEWLAMMHMGQVCKSGCCAACIINTFSALDASYVPVRPKPKTYLPLSVCRSDGPHQGKLSGDSAFQKQAHRSSWEQSTCWQLFLDSHWSSLCNARRRESDCPCFRERSLFIIGVVACRKN